MNVTEEKDAFASLVKHWRPDLILVCTDDEPSKHSVNEVAMRLGIPMVIAGVYDAGIGGEVIVVRLGRACYGCIAAETQRPSALAAQGSAIDYNHLDLDELRSTAALNLDIEQIALLQSRVALNLLLGGEPELIGVPSEVNLFIYANRLVPGTFERPLHCEFHVIARRPDCLVCGDSREDVDTEAQRILDALHRTNGELTA